MSVSPTLALNNLIKERIRKGKKTYKLGFGQSPFPVPEVLVSELRTHAHVKDYLPPQGLEQLQVSIAHYCSLKYKATIKPDNIIVGPGSKEFIFLTQLMSRRRLILPSPSWVSYDPQAQLLNRKISWLESSFEDKWRLNISQLESDLQNDNDPALLILNYPNNPTGQSLSKSDLEQITSIARKYNLIILSDEIYSEFSFEKHQSITELFPEGTIICNGLSKWCGAGGWRLGYTIFPSELIQLKDAVVGSASETYSCAPAPIQYAAIKAFENGTEIQQYTRSCKQILQYINNYIIQNIDSTNIKVHPSQGGFYLFVQFNKSIFDFESSAEMCNRLLDETGVALLPGHAFGRPATELSARLAYLDIDGKELINEIQAIKKPSKELYLEILDITNAVDLMNSWS